MKKFSINKHKMVTNLYIILKVYTPNYTKKKDTDISDVFIFQTDNSSACI